MSLGYTLNFLFLEIFSRKLKKLSLLFQFSRKFFPKMEINVCPKSPFYNANLSLPVFHSYQTSFLTLLGGSLWNQKLKTTHHASVSPLPNFSLKENTTPPSLSVCIWLSPSLVLPLSFYSRSSIITLAIFWWCECNSWPWVIWVWWGGWGSSCDVFWCFVLYHVWGFLCVLVDLKPTANPTELVRETDGKRQSETWGLSVNNEWQNLGGPSIWVQPTHGHPYPQSEKNTNLTLKRNLMPLFTYLKIILLQYF